MHFRGAGSPTYSHLLICLNRVNAIALYRGIRRQPANRYTSEHTSGTRSLTCIRPTNLHVRSPGYSATAHITATSPQPDSGTRLLAVGCQPS